MPCNRNIRTDGLGIHNHCRRADGFADNHIHFGYVCVCEGICKPRSSFRNSFLGIQVCLIPTNIGQSQHRNAKRIAERHKISRLLTAFHGQNGIHLLRHLAVLVADLAAICHGADSHSVQLKEARHHIFRIISLYLKKVIVICQNGKGYGSIPNTVCQFGVHPV